MAELVYKAMVETKIEFKNVNYKEIVRYLALIWTGMECKMRRVLPWRTKQGTRPGMTGEGPLGPDEGNKDQWTFPKVSLTK